MISVAIFNLCSPLAYAARGDTTVFNYTGQPLFCEADVNGFDESGIKRYRTTKFELSGYSPKHTALAKIPGNWIKQGGFVSLFISCQIGPDHHLVSTNKLKANDDFFYINYSSRYSPPENNPNYYNPRIEITGTNECNQLMLNYHVIAIEGDDIELATGGKTLMSGQAWDPSY